MGAVKKLITILSLLCLSMGLVQAAVTEVNYYYAGSKLVASEDSQGLEYHLQDRLGSNRVTVKEDGSLSGRYKSLPFGQTIENNGERFEFTGKEEDASGLHYFGARYLDTETGRFITVDPVEDGNDYAYVRNNPMNYVDPTGMAANPPGPVMPLMRGGQQVGSIPLYDPYAQFQSPSTFVASFSYGQGNTPGDASQFGGANDASMNFGLLWNIGRGFSLNAGYSDGSRSSVREQAASGSLDLSGTKFDTFSNSDYETARVGFGYRSQGSRTNTVQDMSVTAGKSWAKGDVSYDVTIPSEDWGADIVESHSGGTSTASWFVQTDSSLTKYFSNGFNYKVSQGLAFNGGSFDFDGMTGDMSGDFSIISGAGAGYETGGTRLNVDFQNRYSVGQDKGFNSLGLGVQQNLGGGFTGTGNYNYNFGDGGNSWRLGLRRGFN